MFVTVSMDGAEQASTATGEPSQPNLLLTRLASVLLLLPVLLTVLLTLKAAPYGPRLGAVLPVPGRGEDGYSGLGSGQTGCRGGSQTGETGGGGGGWWRGGTE